MTICSENYLFTKKKPRADEASKYLGDIPDSYRDEPPHFVYPGADSNCHTFAGASPSSWCVYQFRHLGMKGAQIYPIFASKKALRKISALLFTIFINSSILLMHLCFLIFYMYFCMAVH